MMQSVGKWTQVFVHKFRPIIPYGYVILLFIQQPYPVVSDAYWSARNLRLSRFLFGVSINLIVRTTG